MQIQNQSTSFCSILTPGVPGSEEDLPIEHPKLLADIEAVEAKIKDLSERRGKSDKTQLAAIKEEIQTLGGEVTALQGRCLDQQQAINFKKSQAAGAHRQQYMSKRWQVTKISQKLLGGHFPQKLAKWLGEVVNTAVEGDGSAETSTSTAETMMKNLSVNPTQEGTFNSSVVALWANDCEHRPLKDVVAKNSGVVTAKKAAQEAKMEENGTWVGALGCINDWAFDEDCKFMGLDLMGCDMTGSKAWMVSMRDSARRWQPSGVPLAGVPALLIPLTATVFVHGFMMNQILEQGIALNNWDAFLATESGAKHLKDQYFCLRVGVDQMCFIPPGYNITVTYVHQEAVEKKRIKVKTPPPSAHVLHIPLVVDEWKGGLGEAVLNAMMARNTEAFSAKASSSMWVERKTYYEKYFKVA